MYKCSECQNEYETRPIYCDCGNDTFVEIGQSDTTTYIKENFFRKHEISAFALAFFVTCLLLSLLIILIPVKQSQTQDNTKDRAKTENTEKSQKAKKSNIPDIDSLWREEKFLPKTVNQTSPKSNLQPAPEIKVKSSPKAPSNASQKVSQKASPNAAIKPSKQTPAKIIHKNTPETKTVKKEKTISPEVLNYKVALRQALFSNLSITAINGKGKCGIEFNIDKNGKLTNRAFTFRSDNKTVNDEVYKMLMKMPKFYPPPDAYKGEKIKMTFAFDYGNYVINYTN